VDELFQPEVNNAKLRAERCMHCRAAGTVTCVFPMIAEGFARSSQESGRKCQASHGGRRRTGVALNGRKVLFTVTARVTERQSQLENFPSGQRLCRRPAGQHPRMRSI
jgi:hypothetical protein